MFYKFIDGLLKTFYIASNKFSDRPYRRAQTN